MNPNANDARILIIDDEPANVLLLACVLRQAGYSELCSTTDPRESVQIFSKFKPDIVLLDLRMPYMDGFAVMEALAPLIPPTTYLPILVLTADDRSETKTRALAAGANDFLTKPLDPDEVALRIKNFLETRRLYRALAAQNEQLEAEVRARTQQLLQTEKVATMGSLLAGVAHELNNPLTIITGRTFLLQNALPEGPLGHHVEEIAKAATRCARIIKNFLTLARQWPPERGPVLLNALVHETIELVAYELRTDDVEVTIDAAADLPAMWADPHQLQQVLVNLVMNAHHAMLEAPGLRRLTITTRYARERGRIRLVVADSGPGIPPEIQSRIFQPFFTTKPLGQGTGLGLSLCQGIVESHGGTIRVANSSGPGATFVIELPVGLPELVEPENRPREAESVSRGQRILVVDDEPAVAGVLAAMLTGDGHQVEIVPNGAVALRKLREHAYDLILSDHGMPELDGAGLYRAAEDLDPQLTRRFIFLSGDILSPKTNAFFESTGVPRVNKPFTMEEVREAVERVSGS